MTNHAKPTGTLQQDKKRKPLLKHAGFALFLVGITQIIWSLVQIIVFPKSGLLNVMHGFGLGCWTVTTCLGYYNYRMSRWRELGWVWTRRQQRRTPTYVGQKTEGMQQTWYTFLQSLVNVLYPVQDQTGTRMQRQALAESMHTHAGLINDLYPADASIGWHAMMLSIIDQHAQANIWQRMLLHHRIRRVYKTSSWVDAVSLQFDPAFAIPMGSRRPTDLDKVWFPVVDKALRQQKMLALRFADEQWFLYSMVASAEASAQALAAGSRAFDPTLLKRPFVKWRKAHMALL